VRVFWSSETRARNESDSTSGWEALLGGFGLFFERSTTGRSRDHLARGSMKNAANCASTCELQDT